MEVGTATGGFSHEVAAEEAEFGLRVEALDSADKPGGMEIAGGFSGYEHIFHL